MASPSSSSAIFRAIVQARRSARRFQTDRTINPAVLREILESSLRSPSSFNLQPTQIIMVQARDVKERLSTEAMLGIGNQYRTRDASALAVFLSDLRLGDRIRRVQRLERDSSMRDVNYLNMLPIASAFLIGEGHAATFLKQTATDVISKFQRQPMPSIEPVQAWSYKNTALVAQTYVLAATSHGLATSMMEGYDARRVKEILRIPDRYDVPLLVATGYDFHENDDGDGEDDGIGRRQQQTPRLGLDEVVFGDTFGSEFDLSSVNEEENDDESVASNHQ